MNFRDSSSFFSTRANMEPSSDEPSMLTSAQILNIIAASGPAVKSHLRAGSMLELAKRYNRLYQDQGGAINTANGSTSRDGILEAITENRLQDITDILKLDIFAPAKLLSNNAFTNHRHLYAKKSVGGILLFQSFL